MTNLYPVVKRTQEPSMIDLEDEVLHTCVCGSKWWNVQVSFDEYEIASYLTDMACALCGQKAKAPTLIDSPEFREWREQVPDEVPNSAFYKGA
jgi:hypothetical protein